MSDDAPRKLLRQFQCREYLWEGFEQLAEELECSVEYLLNESMRQYLRSQGRVIGPPGRNRPPAATGAWLPSSSSNEHTPAGRPSKERSAPRVEPTPAPRAQERPSRSDPTPLPAGNTPRKPPLPPLPPKPLPAVPKGQLPPLPPTLHASNPGPELPLGGGLRPQVTPARKGLPTMPGGASAPRLTLYAFAGDQEVAVEKEEFFIGRGQKYCDLVLRDGNVSRQHARVIREDGLWWITDNNSTNGVLFNGERIERKVIEDGDIYTICEHEIRFEYR